MNYRKENKTEQKAIIVSLKWIKDNEPQLAHIIHIDKHVKKICRNSQSLILADNFNTLSIRTI